MTDAEKIDVLRAALRRATCDYSTLGTWLLVNGDPEAVRNPQTPERHNMWCTRCKALEVTK